MEKRKIICDLIHGYVKICKNTEKIINHESFQRLKHIGQMSAYHLYPSANHTRFEHSLGVMKLALRFYYYISDQIKELQKAENHTARYIDNTYKFNLFHLQYAALLHDVGHAPLSHLGEAFYNIKEIKKAIQFEIEKNKIKFPKYKTLKNGSNHEWMSCYIIIKNIWDILKEIAGNEYVTISYEYIIRIITGNYYNEENNYSKWDSDIIISIVNSKTIDVDKLDYLMRDNFMTGNIGPSIDSERLIESLTINKNKHLSFSKIGLSSIQKVVECRDSIYLWVCNHHTVVYTDYLLRECIKHMGRLNNIKALPKFINIKRIHEMKAEILQYYEDKGSNYRLKKNLTKHQKSDAFETLKVINYIPYKEAINLEEYFSVNAISERQIDDNEIYTIIKRAKNIAVKDESSTYTKTIVFQLLNRKFLKPIWKTIFEFERFVTESFQSSDIRKDIIDYIEASEMNRKKIVSLICNNIKCKLGEVFLIVRPNKFYLLPELSKIYITIKDKDGLEKNESLSKLLPQKDYTQMFSEIAFYLYCKEENKKAVIEEFIKIMSNYRNINKMYKEIEK